MALCESQLSLPLLPRQSSRVAAHAPNQNEGATTECVGDTWEVAKDSPVSQTTNSIGLLLLNLLLGHKTHGRGTITETPPLGHPVAKEESS